VEFIEQEPGEPEEPGEPGEGGYEKKKDWRLAGLLEAYKGLLEAVKEEVPAYDPGGYFGGAESVAREMAAQCGAAAAQMKGEFANAQSAQSKQVGDIYADYSNYVTGLRQSVYEAYRDELDHVGRAKDLFVEAGQAAADESRALIGQFVAKLPNSRDGQSVNQAVAEFVTAPVEFQHTESRGVVAVAVNTYERDGPALFLLCASCLVLLVTGFIRVFINRRKEGSS
jgi:hypothetical protein